MRDKTAHALRTPILSTINAISHSAGRPGRHQVIYKQQHDCTDHRANKSGRLAGRIKTHRLTTIGSQQRPGNAYSGCDKKPGWILAGRQHLGKQSHHKSDQNCPNNTQVDLLIGNVIGGSVQLFAATLAPILFALKV